MVVDDQSDLLDGLARTLERHGHDSEKCLNAELALKLLSRDRFDLLITDITMPDMDGVELIQRVLSQELLPHNRIVALTALGKEHPSVQWLHRNKVSVLSKPLRAETLKHHLDGMLPA